MRFKLQVVLEKDEENKEDITLDIATFDKGFPHPGNIGLSLADADHILKAVQRAEKQLKIKSKKMSNKIPKASSL